MDDSPPPTLPPNYGKRVEIGMLVADIAAIPCSTCGGRIEIFRDLEVCSSCRMAYHRFCPGTDDLNVHFDGSGSQCKECLDPLGVRSY